MKDNIKHQFKSDHLVQRKTIPAGDNMPESLDDWEREVRREEQTGSPSTILPLISSLLTSCHCSSRLLSPLLQTLLNTINQPNPSSHSGSEEFPLMPQSEVLLDLLDLTGEDFKSEKWAPSVTALIMRLRATALASMILQVIKKHHCPQQNHNRSSQTKDDWTWFFGEQSEYVSHLVQNTEVFL